MGNEKSGLKGGGVARLTACAVLVWDSGHPALPACRSPPVALVFAKSAQDAGGMYRRGGEGEKEGAEERKKKRVTYERTVGRTTERQNEE